MDGRHDLHSDYDDDYHGGNENANGVLITFVIVWYIFCFVLFSDIYLIMIIIIVMI